MSFLENSADFNANSSSRAQDGGGSLNGYVSDPTRVNVRRSPAISIGHSPGNGRTSWPQNALDRDSLVNVLPGHSYDGAVTTAANHVGASSGLRPPHGRSPLLLGTNQNLVMTGAGPTFVTSATSNLLGGSIRPLVISHAALNRPATGPTFVEAKNSSSVVPSLSSVSPQLQDAIASNLLKAGISVQWPSIIANNNGGAGMMDAAILLSAGSIVSAARPEDESPPVWKKKKSQEFVSF